MLLPMTTRRESAWKAIMYRLYATTVTTAVALLVFQPDSSLVPILSSFFALDILMGTITYYTFERWWVHK
jgi:hypothetical protein